MENASSLWKKNLWEFFTSALLFWIGRPAQKAEKIGVFIASVGILALVIFT